VNRRGLLGSIVAAPVAVAHALGTSGLGRFWVGSINFGKLQADAGSVTFGKSIFSELGEKFSSLDAYELGEPELARYDAIADEYAAIQKGIIGPSQAILEYPASWFKPPLGFAPRVVFPFDGDHAFPDVGEL
jgi:hypothetical protein